MSLYFSAARDAGAIPTTLVKNTSLVIGKLFPQPAPVAVQEPATATQADLQKQLETVEQERVQAEAEAAGAEALLPEEKSKLPGILLIGGGVLLLIIVGAVALKRPKAVAGYRRKRRSRR